MRELVESKVILIPGNCDKAFTIANVYFSPPPNVDQNGL
jgi:hypothetical protein